MALNTAGKTLAANGLAAGITHLSLHSADPGATGLNETSAGRTPSRGTYAAGADIALAFDGHTDPLGVFSGSVSLVGASVGRTDYFGTHAAALDIAAVFAGTGDSGYVPIVARGAIRIINHSSGRILEGRGNSILDGVDRQHIL